MADTSAEVEHRAPPARAAYPPAADAADAAAAAVDAADAQARLLAACAAGDAAGVAAALAAGADAAEPDDATGETPLMKAADAGSPAAVEALLAAGAPWLAQDRQGNTAGEYAMHDRPTLDVCLEHAVRAELLLGAIERRAVGGAGGSASAGAPGAEPAAAAAAPNAEYLAQPVEYTAGGQLVDAQREGVMMSWEAPLMEAHAAVLAPAPGLAVLNVGFGLGLVDAALQARRPARHIIIEAHPGVHARMLADGWAARPGVTILFGRWQDVIGEAAAIGAAAGGYDGVFFDTYGEYYAEMREFHAHLPRLLKAPTDNAAAPDGGIYSFFNGLAPDNLFFHLVYGEIARRELNALGLAVRYDPVAADSAAAPGAWDGVKSRYWYLPTYFLPVCRLVKAPEAQ
jgi:protein arginine N-methyltransferase 2